MNRKLSAVLAMCLSLPFVPAVQAQTQGDITGEVTDSSGAAVPGARLTLTHVETNAVREGVANGSGVYRFPSLVPGHYSVKVEADGFKPVVRSGIEVQVQQMARIDFALQLGSERGGTPDGDRECCYGHGDRKPEDCGDAVERPQFPATGGS